MARHRPLPLHLLHYVLARCGVSALHTFDPHANLRAAAALGKLAYRLDKRHRTRARQNLINAFPDWPEERIDTTAQGAVQHLVRLGVELMTTPRLITPSTWARHLHLGRIGDAIRHLNAGKPAILVTGHVGNWEVLGFFLAFMGYHVHAIARPLDNPFLHEWVMGVRERHGLRIITKFDAAEQMIKVLDDGGVLAFIADQNAGDRGIFVPFFHQLASTYKSIGLLAMRKRVPIICGCAHRESDHYEFMLNVYDFIHPSDWEGHPDPLFYISARYSRAMQRMIEDQPDQYLWMHRRWKSRPRWQRDGEEMPAAVRRNLESLPWMTPEEMARLATAAPAVV